MKKSKVQVSERALVARIRRVLARHGQTLRRCRVDAMDFCNLGTYYTVDISLNCIVQKDVDIVALGRELGILKAWESRMGPC